MLVRRSLPRAGAVVYRAPRVCAASAPLARVSSPSCACRPVSTGPASTRVLHTRALYSQQSGSSAPDGFDSTTVMEGSRWPSLPVLPDGSVLVAYLAHSGQLGDLLDELHSDAITSWPTTTMTTSDTPVTLYATVLRVHGNLVLARLDPDEAPTEGQTLATPDPNTFIHPLHAATVWLKPTLIDYKSINDAAKQLRRCGASTGSGAVRWSAYEPIEGLHRRTALVLQDVPAVPKQLEENIAFPLSLPAPPPARSKPKNQISVDSPANTTTPSSPATTIDPPLRSPGAFTLLSSSQLLCSPVTSCEFPNGRVAFVWDRRAPPSRAYLKLWEALTRMQTTAMTTLGATRGRNAWSIRRPQYGQVVLDLGAAPGGWTWAAQQCGATVVSVDRASLADTISSLPRVHHFIGSGFAVEPDDERLRPFLEERDAARRTNTSDASATPSFSPPRVDWLLSDIICFPDRALTLVRRWLASDGVAQGMVVTVKLQSDEDADEEVEQESSTEAPSKPRTPKGPAQLHHQRTQADVLRQLREIPNGRLVRLCANRNEVTFMWMRPIEDAPEE